MRDSPFDAKEIERQIQRRGRVCQGSDADAIDSGFGDRSDRRQRYSARRFQLDVRGDGVSQFDSFVKLLGRHVVQQHDVRLPVDGVVQLADRVDLDLDRQRLRSFRSSLSHGGF